MTHRIAVVLAAASLIQSAAHSDETITTGTLVNELVDLDRLCEMPAAHYRTLQFSSYDRRAKVPGGPDWFANSDGFRGSPIAPIERVLHEPDSDGIGEYLVAEVEGPGAIVRTWTAAINGRLQVFLDDIPEPLYDGPADKFLHHPYDTFLPGSGIVADTLNRTFYQRDAGYCPIPFARRCRIVWRGKMSEVHFYYVQIRKYAEEVPVQTFSPRDLQTFGDHIRRAAAILADPDTDYPSQSAGEVHDFNITIEPGEQTQAIQLEGSGAISRLALMIDAADEQAALRQTVMHITCDKWSAPQVQSPVGDFFAAAPGVNPYVSLPFTVRGDGRMICRYIMPYKESFTVEFENLGEQQVRIQGTVRSKNRPWDDRRTMHFYARWRIMHGMSTATPVDIPFLLANGSGRYVGTASLMMNPACGTHSNGNWWGEGDEKVFVDDDRFPTWFGTGSEDYYGYSWSSRDIFFFPFCGQPRNDGPANRGFVTNYRFHVIDDQPFSQRISFYMELLTHTAVQGFNYACQAYYYGRSGIIDDHRPITPEDVRKPALPGPWSPLAVRGSANATFFEPEEIAEGEFSYEEGNLWSEGKLMTWTPRRMGDSIKLTVPVPKQGAYSIKIAFVHDARSGKISARLDGHSMVANGAQEVVDLYEAPRTMTRVFHGSQVQLTSGEHEIELFYEGGHNKDRPFVGIDFVWLQPY